MITTGQFPVKVDSSLHKRLSNDAVAYCIQHTLERHAIGHIARGRLTAFPREWGVDHAWDHRHPSRQGYILLALITQEHTPHYECPFWIPLARHDSLHFYQLQPRITLDLIFQLTEATEAAARTGSTPANTT
jgi:hypothetical protein